MQGKVEICGVNTSKLQTLSNAEMMRLIERSQQGDMEARGRLVEGNLKLVLSVVQPSPILTQRKTCASRPTACR